MYHTRREQNVRIDVADALRGIAVAGIILYHAVEHFDVFTEEPITYTAMRPNGRQCASLAFEWQDVRNLRHAFRTEFFHHE